MPVIRVSSTETLSSSVWACATHTSTTSPSMAITFLWVSVRLAPSNTQQSLLHGTYTYMLFPILCKLCENLQFVKTKNSHFKTQYSYCNLLSIIVTETLLEPLMKVSRLFVGVKLTVNVLSDPTMLSVTTGIVTVMALISGTKTRTWLKVPMSFASV